MGAKITRYTYSNSPHLLPLTDDFHAIGGYEMVCLATGFNPKDTENTLMALEEEWSGHPSGSLVITGLAVEGHSFAVIENWEGIESGWYDLPYGGAVKLEGTTPVRVSDGATDEQESGADEGDIRQGLNVYGFDNYEIGGWSGAESEPDATAPLTKEEN